MKIFGVVLLLSLAGTTQSQGSQADCGVGQFWTGSFCDICSIGTYQDQTGQAQCKDCPSGSSTLSQASDSVSDCFEICSAGEFYSIPTGACIACSIGQWGPGGVTARNSVVTGCNRCPSDRPLTGSTGSDSEDDCRANCPAGSELDSNGDCQFCGVGFYKEAGSVRCSACPENRYTAGTGATSEDECSVLRCPVGSYSSGDACELCPSGTYQDEEGSDECKACGDPLSSWRTTPGSDSRTDCEFICSDGDYVADIQLCARCAKGTYRNNAEHGYQSQCRNCPTGFTTSGQQSTLATQCNIALCGIGQQNVAGDMSQCESCPMNTYQDETAQVTCKECPANFRTVSTASTRSTDCRFACDSGYEQSAPNSQTCVACEIGFYKDNSADLFGSCRACTNGRITMGEAATSAAECNTASCQPGTYRDPTNQCVTCPRDFYQDEKWQTQCKPCPADRPITQTSGATTALLCKLECPSGQELNSAETACVPCPSHQFRDASLSFTCQNCPSGLFTANEGATSSLECVIRDCPAGQYSEDTNSPCKNCEKGTYQPEPRQRTCIDCPHGKTTNFEGTVEADLCILTCPAGQQPHGEECEECPRGYYKSGNSPDPCLKCDNDRLTPSTGSASSAACTITKCYAGSYRNSNNICTACPMGKYQSADFQDSCITCPTGTTTYSTGSNAASACLTTDVCELNRDNCYANQTEGVRAECSYNFQTDTHTCSCPLGYSGDGITSCTHICSNATYCGTNGGSCRRVSFGSGAMCDCPEYYKGTNCEVRDVPSDKLPLIVGAVVGSVVGILLLIALAVCLCWCIRRSYGDDSSSSKELYVKPHKEVYESVMTPAIQPLSAPSLPPRPQAPPMYMEQPPPVIQQYVSSQPISPQYISSAGGPFDNRSVLQLA